MADPKDSASKAAIPLELLKVEAAFVKRAVTSSSDKRSKGQGAPSYKRDVMYAASKHPVEFISFIPRPSLLVFMPHHKEISSTGVDKGGSQVPFYHSVSSGGITDWVSGGGFYGSATMGHLRYQFALQWEMAKRGHDFSIFSLTYTLSPGATYPTQLKQAALALNYLLVDEHRDPSSILLGGDSAGGNLAAALLEHIARPHPQVQPVTLSRTLNAALLISPWISFSLTEPSIANNAESDYLAPRALRRASNAYIPPGGDHDHDSQPVTAPPEWWSDVARRVVDKMMIWGGGGEVLIDGIRSFAATVKNGFSEADAERINRDEQKGTDRFTFVVTPRHSHEEMIIDEVFFKSKKGEGAEVIERWLSGALKLL
ncbi:alpha/beta hydrolase fold protein [Diaporthe helianthi]|uniref:Alpha/beta hydrolase fold protein n=1 Tax=Diaporthe helianthi TaxID=158607 RepID=A0A2P5HFI3_DIAHE|nr:alpha/beta hydrolase fold protein [Diaporthe helianthi]